MSLGRADHVYVIMFGHVVIMVNRGSC